VNQKQKDLIFRIGYAGTNIIVAMVALTLFVGVIAGLAWLGGAF